VPGGMALVKSGRLKILGSSSAKRTRALPDVPTITEVSKKEVIPYTVFCVLQRYEP
jgi:tripartite-type tricarboxylate transporter receptor subunit TctC